MTHCRFEVLQMPKYYVFRKRYGTGDTALMVTADGTGVNLPNRHPSTWKFLRAITLIPGSSDSVIVSHDSAIDAIAQEGYYRIPLQNLDAKIRRLLGRGQLFRSFTISLRWHTQ